jgi:hypothetical protein
MEYKLVGHWDSDEFEARVTKHLLEGWQLVGGVSTYVSPDPLLGPDHKRHEPRFVQALVRVPYAEE